MHVNYAPVVDINNNPNNPVIGYRSFGEDKNKVAQLGVAYMKGMQAAGIMACAKHFPGHGRVAGDSHVSVPKTNISLDEWRRTDAKPFKSGITAGADAVMLGHLEYSSVDDAPASLSKKWHYILQKELEFKGMIVSDDMFMLQHSGDGRYLDPVKNAVGALTAGTDALLYVTSNNGTPDTMINPDVLIDGVLNAVQAGTISEDTITKKAERMLGHREQASAFIR